MFYHLRVVAEESYQSNGKAYEIKIVRADEDGHLRAYVSTDALSTVIVEMAGDVSSDMRHERFGDPIRLLTDAVKAEIDSGRVILE